MSDADRNLPFVSEERPSDRSPPWPPRLVVVSTFWRENVSWLLPLVALTTVGLKVLAVSDFDFVTATGVLQSAGSVDVAVGILLTGLPGLVGALMAFVLAAGIGSAFREGEPWLAPLAVFAGFLFVASLFVSLNLLVGYVVIAGVQIALGLGLRAMFSAIGRRSVRAALAGVAESLGARGSGPVWRQAVPQLATLTLLIWPLVSGSSVPWTPPEMVQTKERRLIGYVLGSQEGWLTILRENPRTLARVPATDVIGRSVCRVNPDARPRAVSYLLPDGKRHPPTYTACGEPWRGRSNPTPSPSPSPARD